MNKAFIADLPPDRAAIPWLRAIDEAMVASHLGTAEPTDDYETAKRKLNALLAWHQDIGNDPKLNDGWIKWHGGNRPARKPIDHRGSTMKLKTKEPPFWVVWNPTSTAPVVQHDSFYSAQAEATRLALSNRGEMFIVLQSVESMVSSDIHRVDLRPDQISF